MILIVIPRVPELGIQMRKERGQDPGRLETIFCTGEGEKRELGRDCKISEGQATLALIGKQSAYVLISMNRINIV